MSSLRGRIPVHLLHRQNLRVLASNSSVASSRHFPTATTSTATTSTVQQLLAYSSSSSSSSSSGGDMKINLHFPNVRPRARRFTFEEDEEEGVDVDVDEAIQQLQQQQQHGFDAVPQHVIDNYDSGLSAEETSELQAELASLWKEKSKDKDKNKAHRSSSSSNASTPLPPPPPPSSLFEQHENAPRPTLISQQVQYADDLRTDPVSLLKQLKANRSSSSLDDEDHAKDEIEEETEEMKRERDMRIRTIQMSFQDGSISVDKAMRGILEQLMSDPEVMDEALFGIDHAQLSKDAAEKVKQEFNLGTLNVFRGGDAGGISDRIVAYTKTNEKFYQLVKYEPYSSSSAEKEEGGDGGSGGGVTGYRIRIGKEHYLKTSKENTVICPNKAMANAVIAEWETQRDIIRFLTLHLTELMCRVQDIREDELTRQRMIDQILTRFDSEEICHRENIGPRHHSAKRIVALWDPLLQWFESTYGAKLKLFHSHSSMEDPHQLDALRAFKQAELPELLKDDFELVTLHAMFQYTGSAVIGLALYKGHIDYTKAMDAANLMLHGQTMISGVVQGKHDLDLAELKSNLSATVMFQHLARLRNVME